MSTVLFGLDDKAQKLEQGFINPPKSASPWVYWFWMNGNISKEALSFS
jgi:hypothetical protein